MNPLYIKSERCGLRGETGQAILWLLADCLPTGILTGDGNKQAYLVTTPVRITCFSRAHFLSGVVAVMMQCFGFRRPASSEMVCNRRLETKNASPEELECNSRNEQVELERARNSVRLIQESILSPSDSEDDYAPTLRYRAASPNDYSLAIDFTAVKMVAAVVEKCKLFQSVSSLLKDESRELLSTLEGLHAALVAVAGSPNSCLSKLQRVVEDVLLHSTKAFTFLEKLCVANSSSHKNSPKMSEFTCRFYNQTVRLCEDDSTTFSETDKNSSRLSFGVTTYTVPVPLKKKRVVIPIVDLDGASSYNVELTSTTSKWHSKDRTLSARIESHDRGFSQILHADRVKMTKGSFGWEEAQETVLLTYDDLLVANVASVTGSLLTQQNQNHNSYRASVQIVGTSRIDLDLQNLFVKGVREKDHVYYKCFVDTTGREEVLAIYRLQQTQLHKNEGTLHILGRGNQRGLRHVLVSIIASLGFT